jgi:hypothetical protein
VIACRLRPMWRHHSPASGGCSSPWSSWRPPQWIGRILPHGFTMPARSRHRTPQPALPSASLRPAKAANTSPARHRGSRASCNANTCLVVATEGLPAGVRLQPRSAPRGRPSSWLASARPSHSVSILRFLVEPFLRIAFEPRVLGMFSAGEVAIPDPAAAIGAAAECQPQPGSPRRLRRRITAMSMTATAASASSTTTKPTGALIKYSQIAKAVQMTKPNTASPSRKVRALIAGAAPPILAVGSW